MTSPIILALLPVDLGRTGPSFRRAENNHGPDGAPAEALGSGVVSDLLNFTNHRIECFRHLPMHSHRLVTFHEEGFVAVTLEQFLEFLARNPSEVARIR